MKKVVEILSDRGKTIATMESCTGGYIASAITDIEGSSNVLKYSAVTYSNEYKIKMGVKKSIIDKYSVYSKEVAREMAFNISKFANSDIGIGITGKINRVDEANLYGSDNVVFFSIYDKEQDKYYDSEVCVYKNKNRRENKDYLLRAITNKLIDIL